MLLTILKRNIYHEKETIIYNMYIKCIVIERIVTIILFIFEEEEEERERERERERKKNLVLTARFLLFLRVNTRRHPDEIALEEI